MHASRALPVAPVTIPAWSRLPWLVHGFSTRQGGLSTAYRAGDLNLGFTAADDPRTVQANRERFVTAVTVAPMPLIMVRQIHSATTHRVTAADAGGPLPPLEGDGLVTVAPRTLLGVLTADCVPVLVVDTRRRIVGAFHAGWRGTVERIVEKGITKMRAEFASEPADLVAAIGPAIGACCYRVGEELRERFAAAFPYGDRLFKVNGTSMHLDLVEANQRQLLASGLAPEAITLTGNCTSCEVGRFFSHRAEAGKTGRLLAVVGISGDRPA